MVSGFVFFSRQIHEYSVVCICDDARAVGLGFGRVTIKMVMIFLTRLDLDLML